MPTYLDFKNGSLPPHVYHLPIFKGFIWNLKKTQKFYVVRKLFFETDYKPKYLGIIAMIYLIKSRHLNKQELINFHIKYAN